MNSRQELAYVANNYGVEGSGDCRDSDDYCDLALEVIYKLENEIAALREVK